MSSLAALTSVFPGTNAYSNQAKTAIYAAGARRCVPEMALTSSIRQA
jgi:hypothetical protein